jgi:RHS repeat-associated protein
VANTFDSDNRITASGGTSYAYDDNGNLTSSTDSTGTTTYAWDARNRLASISAPGGQNTTFLYDFLAGVIQQSDAGPTLTLTQSFVLDDLTNVAYIARSNGDSVSVLDVRTVNKDFSVDQNGKLVSSFSYEPFGKTTTTSTYPFQFTGRSPVTAGLYYYRARYYCPALGRFISEDPLGTASGDTLLYKYARNNPVNRTDSSGRLSDCAKCNLIVGGTVGVSCVAATVIGIVACAGTVGLACPVSFALIVGACTLIAFGEPIVVCDDVCAPPPAPGPSCPAK